MKLEKFESGSYRIQKDFKCFVPSMINAEWTWEDSELNTLLERANISLGSLKTDILSGRNHLPYPCSCAIM